jgi:hypothetical protein
MGALANSLPLLFIRTPNLRNTCLGDELGEAHHSPRRHTLKSWIWSTNECEKLLARPTRSTPSNRILISKAKEILFRITFADGEELDIDGLELGRGKTRAALDHLEKRHGRVRTMTRL